MNLREERSVVVFDPVHLSCNVYLCLFSFHYLTDPDEFYCWVAVLHFSLLESEIDLLKKKKNAIFVLLRIDLFCTFLFQKKLWVHSFFASSAILDSFLLLTSSLPLLLIRASTSFSSASLSVSSFSSSDESSPEFASSSSSVSSPFSSSFISSL